MRKTVLVPVTKLFCDAHIAKDGSEIEATSSLTLGKDTWHLCLEHDVSFGRYLCDALGAPSENEAAPDIEPASEPEPEPEAAPMAESAPDPVPSVMIAGEVPGYDWEDAREALRCIGYEVVGRADGGTVLLILGEGGDRNGTKLRDAAERSIPVMDVRKPGRFRDAIRAGELIGGDPLPEPAKVDRSGMSERERNRAVRAWARENGYTIPTKGRIPMHVRHAYELTHKEASEGKAVAA